MLPVSGTSVDNYDFFQGANDVKTLLDEETSYSSSADLLFLITHRDIQTNPTTRGQAPMLQENFGQ
jgi:hypothetical protein